MRLRLALGRLKTGVAIEAVALRVNGVSRHLQVYLRRRERSETYAGMLHIPGGWFRPGDKEQYLLDRIALADYHGEKVYSYQLVFTHPWTTAEGSSVVSVIQLVKFAVPTCSVRTGKDGWYDVDELANEDVIPEHLMFIKRAAAAYR